MPISETVEIDILARTEQAVSGLESFIKKLAAAYISYESLKRLVVDSVKAFLEAEQAEARLGVALRTTGQYSETAMRSLTAMSQALAMHTIYEDDATKAAAAMLIQIGHLTTDGVQKAIPAIMDYASAMGVDLTQAATQFAQAIEGGRNTFQRFGISLKDAHTPTERFNILIGGLAKNFSGVSDALAKTTGGQLKIFQNQIGELKETLGSLVAIMLLPGLQMLNQTISARQIIGADISQKGASVETLKQYQTILSTYLGTLNKALIADPTSSHTISTIAQIKEVQQTLSAITQEIRRRPAGKN